MSENMYHRCESPQVSLARSNHGKYVNSSIHHSGQCHNCICRLLVTALIFRSPWVTARKIRINAHRHNSRMRNNIMQQSQYHWPAAPSLHKQYLLMGTAMQFLRVKWMTNRKSLFFYRMRTYVGTCTSFTIRLISQCIIPWTQIQYLLYKTLDWVGLQSLIVYI